MSIIPLLNIILCSVILILSIRYTKLSGERLPLYIGLAFALFGVSHIISLINSKDVFQIIITILRLSAYFLIIYSLTNLLRRFFDSKAQLQEKDKFKLLFSMSPDAVSLIRLKDGLFVDINEGFCTLTGYPKEEVLGSELFAGAFEKNTNFRYVIATKFIDNENSKDFESTIITKAGTKTSVMISARIIRIQNEKHFLTIIRNISELKKSEDALAIERRRLSDILMGTNVGTWEWNIQTGETTFNERWAEIIGYTLEEIAPTNIDTWVKYCHPDDFNKSEELLEMHFNGELGDYEFEARMKHKNGEWVWVLDRGKVHTWDNAGRPLLMSGTHQDITKRKQIEIALKKSEIQYKQLFENMINGFSVHQAITDESGNPIDFRFMEANRYYKDFTGLEPEAIKGKTILELNPNADTEMILKYCNVALTGEPFVTEYYSQTFNKYIRVNCYSPERGFFAAIFEDISENKLAEQEILKFHRAVESSTESIFMTNLDGVITYTNPEFEKLYGYSSDEIVGKTTPRILKGGILKTEDYEYFWQSILKKQSVHLEILNKTKDGRLLTIESSANPILNEKDERIGFIAIQRDISDRKAKEKEHHRLFVELADAKLKAEENLLLKNHLIEELSETKVRLEKTNSEKDKFFSIIAHDLKSPFSGFIGLTKIIAEDINELSTFEIQEHSKSMLDSANNLFSLLENLLEWSRMQRDMIKFTPKISSLTSIVLHNIEIERITALNKDIRIESNITDDIQIMCDEFMLNTVLRNLISNAIKFTKKGGKIVIGTRLKLDDGFAEVYIRDNGIGMSASLIDKLFKIDQEVSRPGTDNETSTGLGLLLCKDFIEKHEGKIWAESIVGMGSTFHIVLPNHI